MAWLQVVSPTKSQSGFGIVVIEPGWMSEEFPIIFFIGGRGRSGTTLLGRMLGAHPKLEVAPEGFFVMNLWARYGTGPWDPARVDRFCDDLVFERRMATWGLDLGAISAELKGALPELDFRRACRTVYRSYVEVTRGRTGVVAIGDKNPHYALFTGTLAAVFPNARFVHMVRDPRDNVLSYRKVPFDVSDTAALAYRWRRYNEELLAVSERHPNRFLRVSYEDVLERPEGALTAVCEFLGQPFDSATLSFADQRPEGFYGEGSPWFEKLAEPLDAGQARKWESSMSVSDIATVESICGATLERLGYARKGSESAASLRWFGAAYGWGTVLAEKLLFGTFPARWRMRLINAHRARTGRV